MKHNRHLNNPDTDSLASQSNRIYYQSVFRQIRASEHLKERLIHMDTLKYNKTGTADNQNRHLKTPRQITWKAAAIAVILAAALPASAYAANHYFGIADFFRQSGQPLPEEAEQLIETGITQTPENAKADTDASDGLPVTFTVQEALCDSGSVNIVIEAAAAESGRYLLVPDDCTTPEDSVENIGIHKDISIEEYARSKGLEILYIGNGFSSDSPFSPSVCHLSSKSVQDDILDIFISADRSAMDTDLNTVLTHTIRAVPANGEESEILRTSSSFQLDDKSTSQTASYSPKDSGTIPGTAACVQRVSMEQTEVFTYVDIFYQNPQGADKDDGLYFDVLDDNGNAWPLNGGRGIEQLEDGNYCLHLCYEKYEKTQLPELCTLRAYDCLEKNEYGQIELMKIE